MKNGLVKNRIEWPEGVIEADLVLTHERGQLVRHLRSIVGRTGGAEGWSRLLASVSEPCRQAFDGKVGVFEWVDAQLATELSLAYCEDSAHELTGDRGREAARVQLTTVNRWMVRFLSPSFLLSNFTRFFHFYFKGGRTQVEHEGGDTGLVHIWAIGLYPEFWSSGGPAWLEESLRMTGCQDVQVRYEAPSGQGLEAYHHRYHLSWR